MLPAEMSLPFRQQGRWVITRAPMPVVARSNAISFRRLSRAHRQFIVESAPCYEDCFYTASRYRAHHASQNRDSCLCFLETLPDRCHECTRSAARTMPERVGRAPLHWPDFHLGFDDQRAQQPRLGPKRGGLHYCSHVHAAVPAATVTTSAPRWPIADAAPATRGSCVSGSRRPLPGSGTDVARGGRSHRPSAALSRSPKPTATIRHAI
jgi:hypothetical protein